MSDQYDKYVDLIEVNHSDLYGASLNYDSACKAVEQAVLEERERCARIAEAQAVEPDPDECDPYDEYEMGLRSSARFIAAAIRKGLTCPA